MDGKKKKTKKKEKEKDGKEEGGRQEEGGERRGETGKRGKREVVRRGSECLDVSHIYTVLPQKVISRTLVFLKSKTRPPRDLLAGGLPHILKKHIML